jgi:hypothetical protein
MEKVPVFLDEVEEEVALYLDLEVQVELVHDEEGIHRSEEPAKFTGICERDVEQTSGRDVLSKSIRNF